MAGFMKKLSATVVLGGVLLTVSVPVFADVEIVQNNLFPEFLASGTVVESRSITPNMQTNAIDVTLDNTITKVNYCVLSGDIDWSVDVVIAKSAVGSGESLASIAKRSQSVVAISGSSFQNYDSLKPKDPYGLLICRGRVLHNDLSASQALVFSDDGSISIETIKAQSVLTVGDKNYKVMAINHTPAQKADAVTIFDQSRGSNLGFNYGTNYIVQNGVVTKIQENIDSAIPANGYVINIVGESDLRKVLKLNKAVNYSIKIENFDLSKIQAALEIEKQLVKDGESCITSPILLKNDTTAVNRTAVGITKDGDLLLVAGVRATNSQLAEIMLQIGAEQAVSLNGGASSGLIIGEKYLAEPICDISNAIVFKEKPATIINSEK